MFNKKKEDDKKLPDFPINSRMTLGVQDIQPYPFVDEEDESIHMLPSFPDSPMDKGFSQSAIKDAVTTNDDHLPELPDFEDSDEVIPSRDRIKSNAMEMREWEPSHRFNRDNAERSKIKPHYNEDMQRGIDSKKQIFVKLEKFQSARNSLEIIREKLDEVEELLKTIREVKKKEDEEISLWEREMDYIKTRINSITNDIFENPQY